MEFRRVESYQETRPEETDTTSSKVKVYLRRNIKEVPNLDLEGNETDGTHWVMDEAELTHEEYEWYQREMDSPALDMMMQQVNDVTANQELTDITAQENHEEQMQLLADIQADILLGGEE